MKLMRNLQLCIIYVKLYLVCSGKVATMWPGGHGSNPGYSLSDYGGKAVYTYPFPYPTWWELYALVRPFISSVLFEWQESMKKISRYLHKMEIKGKWHWNYWKDILLRFLNHQNAHHNFLPRTPPCPEPMFPWHVIRPLCHFFPFVLHHWVGVALGC